MNVNLLNMCLSWISLFILWWMWLLNIVPIEWKSVIICLIFALVAFGSAVSELARRKNG
jgi:hypothetical protein